MGQQIRSGQGAALQAEGGERAQVSRGEAVKTCFGAAESDIVIQRPHRTHTPAVSFNKATQAAIFQWMAPAERFHTWAATAHFLFPDSKQASDGR